MSDDSERRTAHKVINQAIIEFRPSERLAYAISVVVVGIGAFALIYGATHNQGIVALAGPLAASLFWPAMNHIERIRREKLGARVLEFLLSRADNNPAFLEKVLSLVKDLFGKVGRKSR